MEKLNFIERQIDKWVNLSAEKRIVYITGVIIVVLGSVIFFGARHYENKLTEITNEKIALKNEYTINLNMVISRYDGLLSIEKETTKQCHENFIKYLEKNEKQYKEILFYNKKIKEVKE